MTDKKLLEEVIRLTVATNWKKIDTKEYFNRIHEILMQAQKLQPYYTKKKKTLWSLVQ